MQCPMKTSAGNETLIAYGARALTPEAETEFVRHFSGCDSCRSVAEAQRTLWGTLDQWQPLAISRDFDQKLYARIEEDRQRPWFTRLFDWNWSWRPAMPVAAACTAVIAAFLIRGPLLDQKAGPVVQPANVDIEQVERALDDMDMLKQLGVVPTPAPSGTRSDS